MAEDDAVDADLLLKMATQQNANAFANFADVINSIQWLQILAVPRIFRNMTRMPTREHLLSMVDIFIAYVRRGDRDTRPEFDPVPYERREPLALRLREVVETWTPPDLPSEITEAARALLYADGMNGGPGGWDSLPDPDMRPEEYLLWPEGVPALLAAERGDPGRRDDEGGA